MRVAVGVDVHADSLKTYAKNFPDAVTVCGSVASTKAVELCQQQLTRSCSQGDPLVVISGPPCQGFSVAGSRDPADSRNRVLGAVGRAIVELKPDCALVENVSMLLADTHRNRLRCFADVLRDGGYFVKSVILDARRYGVPQKRKRVFLFVTPIEVDTEDLDRRLRKLERPEVTTSSALFGLPVPPVRPDAYCDDTDNGIVSNHFAMQHSQRVVEKISKILPGKGPMSYRRLHPDLPSNTLFSGHRAPPAHFSEPRSITVREAARLQGFPDTFRVFGSFGNQMGQVTNAVPPPLAIAALRVLVDVAGVKLT